MRTQMSLFSESHMRVAGSGIPDQLANVATDPRQHSCYSNEATKF